VCSANFSDFKILTAQSSVFLRKIIFCVISGFGRSVSSSVFRHVVTRHRLVVIIRRFGITYRSYLQGSDGCPETSVTSYQSTLRNDIPEERRSQDDTCSVGQKITVLLWKASVLIVQTRQPATFFPSRARRNHLTRSHCIYTYSDVF